MLTVEDYGQIRRAHRDGMSIRTIARTFHRTRRKIREVLACPEPRRYTRVVEPATPKLGPFKSIIDEILTADQQAPRKQRHKATQIFRRLVKEQGYRGGYDQVRRYVGRQQQRERETFIPLSHDAGQRAEADFGHIYVDFPDGRRQVAVLLVTWAYSYCPFAIALPTERTEAILHGMVTAFEFFGCVPKEVWWDNPTTVAIQILKGRDRRLNERYAALASHYNFEPLFCLPARGNEKPHVENRVKNLQQRWATPVPQTPGLAELNDYLRQCCLEDRQRTATGRTETIGQRFEQDRSAAVPLPARAFDACITQPAKVDKYQTVRFDYNCYSVPRSYAFQTVSVKGYVDWIEVVAGGQVVARHPRCYQRDQQILNPLDYLATLGRKPACLDHADVYRHWQLPRAFIQLRQSLEARYGQVAGARQYVRVLQLLGEHPLERVRRAIEWCSVHGGPQADWIVQRVARLRSDETQRPDLLDLSDQSAAVRQVQVPLPDLSRFDQFLSLGDPDDVPESPVVAQNQPETVAAAEHVCRI
jgi:transposase